MNFWFDPILVHRWLPEGTCGKWSVRRTVIEGSRFDWLRLGGDPYGNHLPPGIYTGLFRKLDDSSEQRVMFDELAEIKEAERFVAQAHGRVLVTGLGLGMIASWLASKAEVTQVDVVEIDPDVIALVAPFLLSKKIRIIHADAYSYQPTEKYDSVWHDCFYEIPLNVAQLKACYPCEVQDYWQPGVQTAPVPRRTFMGGMIAAAILVMAWRAKAAHAMPVVLSGPVQEVTDGTSSGATHNITIAAPAAGNSLIMSVGSITSVTGITGGGITWVAAIISIVFGVRHEIWYGHNSSGSGTNIALVITGRSGGPASANVTEWAGLNNAVPDATNTGDGTATGTTPTAGSVTTSNANSLVISGGAWPTNQYSSGPTNSFTRRSTVGAVTVFEETASQIETVTGSYSTAWTLSTAIAWQATIAAFGAPASGPTNAQRSAGFFMGPP